MDATFRPRRWYRDLGLCGTLGFTAWAGLGVYFALTGPAVSNRVALTAIMGGIPLAMSVISIWLLVFYWRKVLKIEGNRITFRGVIQRKEIDLHEVTEARWRTIGGSLLLRTESTRLELYFGHYGTEESALVINHVRSVLRPEVQVGWNLFAHKIFFGKPRSAPPGKLEPNEVLLRRDRWDCYLVPSLIVAALAGVAGWRSTGELKFFLAAPLPVLAGWPFLRFTTPAEGMVGEKPSANWNPDTVRFAVFLTLWAVVFVAGGTMLESFRARLAHPDGVMIAGGVF